DIANKDGLKPRAGRSQWQDGHHPLKLGEEVEKRIRPAEDHRWPENCPCETRGRDDRFGFALGPQISARPFRVGVERAHMNQPRHARYAAGGDELPRKLDVNTVELAA